MEIAFYIEHCIRLDAKKLANTQTRSTESFTPTVHAALLQIHHIVLISILLDNVMDKNHSDDQINTFRLFSSNDKLLPMLTMVPASLCKAAVCKAVEA